MTPKEQACRIVCDTFGAETGWEHATLWIEEAIEDAIQEALAEEKERCAQVAKDCGADDIAALIFQRAGP